MKVLVLLVALVCAALGPAAAAAAAGPHRKLLVEVTEGRAWQMLLATS